jgi:hypothetical protein
MLFYLINFIQRLKLSEIFVFHFKNIFTHLIYVIYLLCKYQVFIDL